MAGEPKRSSSWPGILLGGVIGFLAGYVIGVFILRLAGTLDGEDGWEDLVALVMSMISFAPVGGLIGATLGVRRDGKSLWAAMSQRRRGITLGSALCLCVAATIFGSIRMDAMSSVFLAVWAFPIGATIGYLIGRGDPVLGTDPPTDQGSEVA